MFGQFIKKTSREKLFYDGQTRLRGGLFREGRLRAAQNILPSRRALEETNSIGREAVDVSGRASQIEKKHVSDKRSAKRGKKIDKLAGQSQTFHSSP